LKAARHPERLRTGIVHFGAGAFHRAHQADYVDRLLQDDPRWGIAAVSLRNGTTVEALKRQRGLYTLAILDEETRFRTIAAHTRFLGPTDSSAIRAQLLDPGVRIVTSTVTEKGYCLGGDGSLDFSHPDIEHDLASLQAPRSFIGWLVLGLADRRAQGLAAFTPVCCDNMASNGEKLRQAVVAFARRLDPELARWIDGEARFPNTVVDSITPAADDRLRRLVEEQTGADDAVPVSREAYTHWVIENVLPGGSPDLASVGVTLASDVAAWEKAKLRILNGAHSTLAYVGLLLDLDTVADAMAHSVVSTFVERLVGEDIIPTLQPSPINLHGYAEATFRRFRNPAIGHRLSQIAWDGSQKLPYRLLDTIIDARASGCPLKQLAIPIAAWILFIERQARSGAVIVDPLADRLSSIARSGDAVEETLQLRQVFPDELAGDPAFRSAVADAVSQMRTMGIAQAISTETVGA
jgi:fructuronate reductase